MPERFNVGDRVLTDRYYGDPRPLHPATVVEVRDHDYVIRYDEAGRHDGDFRQVGRSESRLQPLEGDLEPDEVFTLDLAKGTLTDSAGNVEEL